MRALEEPWGKNNGPGLGGRVRRKLRTWKLSFSPESRCRNEFKSKLIAKPAKSNSLSRITKTSSPPPSRLPQDAAGYENDYNIHTYTHAGAIHSLGILCAIGVRNRFSKSISPAATDPSAGRNAERKNTASVCENKRTHTRASDVSYLRRRTLVSGPSVSPLQRSKTNFSAPRVAQDTTYDVYCNCRAR